MANYDQIRSFKLCPLYIGNAATASRDVVTEVGFSHVVHCMKGFGDGRYDSGVREITISIADLPSENIVEHFAAVFEFLDFAIQPILDRRAKNRASDGEQQFVGVPGEAPSLSDSSTRILIHCQAGKSRRPSTERLPGFAGVEELRIQITGSSDNSEFSNEVDLISIEFRRKAFDLASEHTDDGRELTALDPTTAKEGMETRDVQEKED